MEFRHLVVVRPGSSIFEYGDEAIRGVWMIIHVHPDHFTVNEAILFVRQKTEEWQNINGGHHVTPILATVVFHPKNVERGDIIRLNIECPKNGGAQIHKYGDEGFDDWLIEFEAGLQDVHDQISAAEEADKAL